MVKNAKIDLIVKHLERVFVYYPYAIKYKNRWCYAIMLSTNSSGKMGDSMSGCNRDDEGNIV